MSLEDWLREGRLRPHGTNREEIAGLLRVADRDLADATIGALSADRRFATAYNAILQTATAVVRASGYRVAGPDHHWLTIQALADLMPRLEPGVLEYLDACRRKRNKVDYDSADVVSEKEVDEIVREAGGFRLVVRKWLKGKHPRLAP